jgi:hypothetical protein
VDANFRMELCTPIWLNHDLGDEGVVDILVVDAYSGVELCTSILINLAYQNNVMHKWLKLISNKGGCTI